jgi:CheY-like chemotaxis protein
MKQKLKLILLIDDDESTNFINRIIIEKYGCAEKIVETLNGYKALEFLKSTVDGNHPQPDLIFLDINMPGMNGWEFLERYHQLNEDEKGKVIVVMLSASDNPDDIRRATEIGGIKAFKTKPMTTEMLAEILKSNFGDY